MRCSEGDGRISKLGSSSLLDGARYVWDTEPSRVGLVPILAVAREVYQQMLIQR